MPVEVKSGELIWWFAPYAKGEVLLLLSEIRTEGQPIKRVAYWFVTDVYSEEETNLLRGRIFQFACEAGFNDEGKNVMGHWMARIPRPLMNRHNTLIHEPKN